MGVIAEGILRGCQGLFTPVSLGYPLSVFNKTLLSRLTADLHSANLFPNLLLADGRSEGPGYSMCVGVKAA